MKMAVTTAKRVKISSDREFLIMSGLLGWDIYLHQPRMSNIQKLLTLRTYEAAIEWIKEGAGGLVKWDYPDKDNLTTTQPEVLDERQ